MNLWKEKPTKNRFTLFCYVIGEMAVDGKMGYETKTYTMEGTRLVGWSISRIGMTQAELMERFVPAEPAEEAAILAGLERFGMVFPKPKTPALQA